MRKIEREMLNAIHHGKNWTNSNTSVVCDGNGTDSIEVYLHGHLIAEKTNYLAEWHYNLCGWNTPTTRSRVTAIMREFEPSYVCGVGTKLGQAQVRYLYHPPMDIPTRGWFTSMQANTVHDL